MRRGWEGITQTEGWHSLLPQPRAAERSLPVVTHEGLQKCEVALSVSNGYQVRRQAKTPFLLPGPGGLQPVTAGSPMCSPAPSPAPPNPSPRAGRSPGAGVSGRDKRPRVRPTPAQALGVG